MNPDTEYPPEVFCDTLIAICNHHPDLANNEAFKAFIEPSKSLKLFTTDHFKDAQQILDGLAAYGSTTATGEFIDAFTPRLASS